MYPIDAPRPEANRPSKKMKFLVTEMTPESMEYSTFCAAAPCDGSREPHRLLYWYVYRRVIERLNQRVGVHT